MNELEAGALAAGGLSNAGLIVEAADKAGMTGGSAAPAGDVVLKTRFQGAADRAASESYIGVFGEILRAGLLRSQSVDLKG